MSMTCLTVSLVQSTALVESLLKKHITMAMCQARCNNILDPNMEKNSNSNMEHEYCSNICRIKEEDKDAYTSICLGASNDCRNRAGCRVACQNNRDEQFEEEEVNEIVAIIKRYQLSQAILRLNRDQTMKYQQEKNEAQRSAGAPRAARMFQQNQPLATNRASQRKQAAKNTKNTKNTKIQNRMLNFLASQKNSKNKQNTSSRRTYQTKNGSNRYRG